MIFNLPYRLYVFTSEGARFKYSKLLYAQTSSDQGIPNYLTQAHECVAALSPQVSTLSNNGAPPSRDEVLEHARPVCL